MAVIRQASRAVVCPLARRPLVAVLVPLGLFGSLVALSPQPAAAGQEASRCTVTGYLADTDESRREMFDSLPDGSVNLLDGVPLDRQRRWVVPADSQPVIVVDSTEPLPGGRVAGAALGGQVELLSTSNPEDAVDQYRFVPRLDLSHLGSTIRTIGVQVETGECVAAIAIESDVDPWSTLVGRITIAALTLFALLTVLVARRRRGRWWRRFVGAAPFGLLVGGATAVLLHEAGWIGPFGFPWWSPLAGLGFAAILPLTRSGHRSPTPAPAEVGDSEKDPAPAPAPPRARRAAWWDAAVAVSVAAAMGGGVLLVMPQSAVAWPEVINPTDAEVIFVQTTDQARQSLFEHVQLGTRSAAVDLRTEAPWLSDGAVTAVSVGVPPAQRSYPAWFVGSAEIRADAEVAYIFARFDRHAVEEPWKMTTLSWSVTEPLPAPLLVDNWLAPAPEAEELSLAPEDLTERYAKWYHREFTETVSDDGAGELAADELLALRPGASSYLRDLRDYRRSLTSRNDFVLPDGESEYRYSLIDQITPELAEVDIIPLVDGTALVTVELSAQWTIFNTGDQKSRKCGPAPSIRHRSGGRYRELAIDYQVMLRAWVPLRPAEAGAAAEIPGPVLIEDPVVASEHPSDRSVRC